MKHEIEPGLYGGLLRLVFTWKIVTLTYGLFLGTLNIPAGAVL